MATARRGAMSTEAHLAVRLRPRSGRDELLGLREGVLHARVASPPVDGRANRALCRMVARALGVAPSRVTIARGERSREKLLRIEGLGPADVRSALSRIG
jgi:uncharacterized protein (TIGR00251 family)